MALDPGPETTQTSAGAADTVIPPQGTPAKRLPAARVLRMPLAAAGLSGVLLGLALPSRGLSFLAWVALAPVLRVSRRASVLTGLGLGILAGLVTGVVAIGLPRADRGGALAAGLALEFALLIGGVCGGAALLRDHRPALWSVAVACLGVAAEGLSFSAVPMHLALCFWQWTGLIQLAALAGIWGVSFLAWWLNAALAATSLSEARPLSAPGLAVLLTLIVGARASRIPQEHVVTSRVGAVQLDGPSAGVSKALRAAADAAEIRLLVFPELADREQNAAKRHTSSRWAGLPQPVWMITGFAERDGDRIYNSAGVVSPHGRLIAVYHKMHLFGGERLSFAQGRHANVADLPYVTVGTPICFDTCYTDVCRQMAQMGANLLASPTSDPPTPNDSLGALHAAFHPFRSAENGVSTIRADRHAHSLITDSFGRVVARVRAPGAALLSGPLDLTGRPTFYRRWGDWLERLCSLFAACLIAASMGRSLVTGRSQP